MFENYPNYCTEIVISLTMFSLFHTRLISYWHCHIICSKYLPLTCTRAHRCACRSSLSFSRTAVSHTEPATLCGFWSNSNTGVYISGSNSPDLDLVAYSTSGTINGMSTFCVFKISMNWRSFCCSFGTTWNWNSAVITSGAFHNVV